MAKRILLKLSGEQLQGEFASGFDPARARWIAEQIKPALKTGAEVVIMVGGGRQLRPRQSDRRPRHPAGLGPQYRHALYPDERHRSG